MKTIRKNNQSHSLFQQRASKKRVTQLINKPDQQDILNFQWKNQFIIHVIALPIEIALFDQEKQKMTLQLSIKELVVNQQEKEKKVFKFDSRNDHWFRIHLHKTYQHIEIRKTGSKLTKKCLYTSIKQLKSSIPGFETEKLFHIEIQKLMKNDEKGTSNITKDLKQFVTTRLNNKHTTVIERNQKKVAEKLMLKDKITHKLPAFNEQNLISKSKLSNKFSISRQSDRAKLTCESLSTKMNKGSNVNTFNTIWQRNTKLADSKFGYSQKQTTIGGTSHIIKDISRFNSDLEPLQLNKKQYSKRLMKFDKYKGFDNSVYTYKQQNNIDQVNKIQPENNKKSNLEQNQSVTEQILISTKIKDSHKNDSLEKCISKQQANKSSSELNKSSYQNLDKSQYMQSQEEGTLYESYYEQSKSQQI